MTALRTLVRLLWLRWDGEQRSRINRDLKRLEPLKGAPQVSDNDNLWPYVGVMRRCPETTGDQNDIVNTAIVPLVGRHLKERNGRGGLFESWWSGLAHCSSQRVN
jgi:hypothetical protein